MANENSLHRADWETMMAERAELSPAQREESFRAQIGIMLNSDLPTFRQQAGELLREFLLAPSEEQRLSIFERCIDLWGRFNIERFGEDLVNRLSAPPTNLGAEVRGADLFESCCAQLGPEELEKVEKWTKEVAQFVKMLKEILEESGPDKDYVESVVGENPNELLLKKMAIGICLGKRKKWRGLESYIKGALGVIFGVRVKLDRFGKDVSFCASTVIASQVLADQLGIKSEIASLSGGIYNPIRSLTTHQALVFKDGTVLDLYIYPHLQGLLLDMDKDREERLRGKDQCQRATARDFALRLHSQLP